MNASYDVKFWEIYRNRSSKTPSYVARWSVAGRRTSKTFRTKELANSHMRDLRLAAKNGEAFDIDTGLPESMLAPEPAQNDYLPGLCSTVHSPAMEDLGCPDEGDGRLCPVGPGPGTGEGPARPTRP
ncbi:hypothetical protein GCM10022226_33170 [Sphaerisporangium flaviroseum]|uniref:WGR domain-containing protein n=1 Tax=Sphaerisporangium flaviroseum TaxID=509199 RepID=A0ABP7I5T0_9ACTN